MVHMIVPYSGEEEGNTAQAGVYSCLLLKRKPNGMSSLTSQLQELGKGTTFFEEASTIDLSYTVLYSHQLLTVLEVKNLFKGKRFSYTCCG